MHRDTTRALEFADRIANSLGDALTQEEAHTLRDLHVKALQKVLTEMDARTGTRDPSKKKRPADKPVPPPPSPAQAKKLLAKKAAKKGRRG